MAIIAITSVVAIAVIAFVLSVGRGSIPEPEPVSPFAHLDERKAAIYENLRDLQFEFRVGKMSDEDYQHSKRDLQKELAQVLAEVDRIKGGLPAQMVVKAAPIVEEKPSGFVCPSCRATFDTPLKFCGECGKPMRVGVA